MSTTQIKVTRCLGAAMSDSDRFGWQVSYVERQFETKAEAQVEADRLRSQPTEAEGATVIAPAGMSRLRKCATDYFPNGILVELRGDEIKAVHHTSPEVLNLSNILSTQDRSK